jgi:protein O-GlcNAc transferase
MNMRPIRKAPSATISEAEIRRRLGQAQAAVAAGQMEKALRLLDLEVLAAVDRLPISEGVDMSLALAGVFHQARQLDRAECYYRRVLEAGPHPMACINLGHICHFTGRLAEAIEWRQKALTLCPDDASVSADLGTSLIFVGCKDEGLDLLRGAVEASGDRSIHSLYLMNLHYRPELDLPTLFEEHRRWANVYAPLDRTRLDHPNDRDPDRRLRIGYLSPDFRTHPVATFFESLLDGHDRAVVEVYGYGQVACPDQVTWRMQAKFDAYHSVCGLDDQAVADMIEADRIDILVDLAGHTGGNRLGVLALKPTPIQVTYLGYPDTTGMDQVDYRLADVHSTPSSLQPYYAEQLVHLPQGFLCFRPPEFDPQADPPPSLKNGYVTFGSFNDSCKVNGPLMSLWAQILEANPGSKLLVKSRAGDDPHVRRIFLDQFQRAGILQERIVIEGQKPAIEYLRLYNQVDIALDSFPYNGTTTTCDALWMGVPVVTLVGEHHASRVGLSILSHVGLGSLAAASSEEYVNKATVLAQSPEDLEKLRASLRPRMMASPLCNAKDFAWAVESAYHRMWRTWCQCRQRPS